jgi:hypothetical protein
MLGAPAPRRNSLRSLRELRLYVLGAGVEGLAPSSAVATDRLF